jgi:hypothetical protein
VQTCLTFYFNCTIVYLVSGCLPLIAFNYTAHLHGIAFAPKFLHFFRLCDALHLGNGHTLNRSSLLIWELGYTKVVWEACSLVFDADSLKFVVDHARFLFGGDG